MKTRIRSLLLKLALSIDAWSFDRFAPKNVKGPIEWRDHVRWFIEGITQRIWAFAYEGSVEEIRDGIDFALDDVNPDYLTPNQREIRARLCEFVEMEEAQ